MRHDCWVDEVLICGCDRNRHLLVKEVKQIEKLLVKFIKASLNAVTGVEHDIRTRKLSQEQRVLIVGSPSERQLSLGLDVSCLKWWSCIMRNGSFVITLPVDVTTLIEV